MAWAPIAARARAVVLHEAASAAATSASEAAVRAPPTEAAHQASQIMFWLEETMYSQTAHFRRTVRARRGNDVHAERSPQVGRDQALLRSTLGSHVVDFSFF